MSKIRIARLRKERLRHGGARSIGFPATCAHILGAVWCHVGRRHPPPRRRARRRIRTVWRREFAIQIVAKLAQDRRGRPALPLLRRHAFPALRLPALCVVGVEVHGLRRALVLAGMGLGSDGRSETARARVAVRHVRLHDEGHVDLQERRCSSSTTASRWRGSRALHARGTPQFRGRHRPGDG